LIDRNRKDLQISSKEITNELQAKQDSEDYAELELEIWTNRLKELRNELERPLIMNVIVDEDKESFIRVIKLSESLESREINGSVDTRSNEITSERFEQSAQKSVLSEDRRLARCLDLGPSAIYGIQHYSSSVHHIRFRIEQSDKPTMFFGIMTQDPTHPEPSCTAPYTNGWWNLGNCIQDGKLELTHPTINIQTGDEVT
jgi:hypothetical protein